MPTTQADIEHNFLLEVAWPTIIDCLGLELIKFMFECLILGLFELLAHGESGDIAGDSILESGLYLYFQNLKHGYSKTRAPAEAKSLFKIPDEGPDSVKMAFWWKYMVQVHACRRAI